MRRGIVNWPWRDRAALLIIIFLGASNATAEYIPDVDPDYRPDPATDEGGFWYKVDKLEEDLKSSPHVLRETELGEHIENMVCQLAGDHCSQIRVYVLKNPLFNASMFPNGMMHVHTGLLLRTANDDQLAAILGHELAHYLRTHQIKQWRQARSGLAVAQWLDMGIAAFTGIYGLATMGAMSGWTAYSRSHESEADLYGQQIMAHAGYDPGAAARLWEYLDAERDADKSKKGRNPFFATHPADKSRGDNLTRAAEQYGVNEHQETPLANRLNALVFANYQMLMDEQLALQEHEQTLALLERHEKLGYPLGLIHYYRAEVSRQSGEPVNEEGPLPLYQKALQSEGAPVQAHRELGYLFLKADKGADALAAFREYLKLSPEADDRQMIDYYVQTLERKTP